MKISLPAMKMPPLDDLKGRAGAWLTGNRVQALYGLLLLGVWGLAVFGWSSLGERALMQRLPPIQSAAQRYAVAVGANFSRRNDLLDSLANDPRLATGLASNDGMESLEIRRALYEFGYLNRLTQLYLWDDGNGHVAQLAGSKDLPPQVTAWLHNLGGRSPALMITGLPDNPTSYTARRVENQNGAMASTVYAVMSGGWQRLLTDLPDRPSIGAYPETVTNLVVASEGQVWMTPPSLRRMAQPFPSLTPGRLSSGPQLVQPGDGQVVVTVPVPDYPEWAVALMLPSSVALGSSRWAQWAVILAALAATVLILWRPSLPIRRKVAKAVGTSLAPMAAMVRPLAAPVLAAIAGGGGKKAVQGPVIKPGDFTPEAMNEGGPKRMRGMNLGSGGGNWGAAHKAKKVVGSSFVPALQPRVEKGPDGQLVPIEKAPPPGKDALAEMIDECLNIGRSQLLYQPIYNANSGLVSMHEVLLRLVDRDGHAMTPAVFIPVCQKFGWMDRLDAHVVQRVLDLNFAGGATPATPLALNISGDTVESIRYLETLMNLAAPEVMKQLVFEVRSQELMQDPGAIKFLREARDMGVRLAVDYFGGGAAMMEASKKIGFDFVKLDATRFASDAMAKKELIVLCRAAQRLFLPVVLEKMETVAMEVFARRIGVTYLQGYLLGKPKPELASGPLPGWRAMTEVDGVAQAPEDPAETAAAAPDPLAGIKGQDS